MTTALDPVERVTAGIVKKIMMAFMFILIVTLLIVLFGYIVMRLWNWLMPELFGLRQIGYWQALGILLLSKILFGGFRGSRGRGFRRHRMMRRWARMTPEERERFRAAMRERCGVGEPPPAKPTASA